MSRDGSARWPAGMALIWGAGCVAGYYVFHKPISQPGVAQLLYLMVTLLAWLGTAANAYGLGRLILPVQRGMSERTLMALRIGLGLYAISFLMLAFGAVGLYQRWLAWLLLLAPLPWTMPPFLGALPAGWLSPRTGREKALALFVLFSLSLMLLLALLPPTAWDSLVYHLTGPALYLRDGGLHHNLDNPYLGFPQGGSMLFLWGMLLVGPEVAQLLHALYVLLTLMLLPEMMQRIAPGRSWLAAALLLAVPTAWMLGAWAYVEWMAMFAGLAAVILLFLAGEEEDAGRIGFLGVLAGVFTAFAFSAKYTTAGMIVGLIMAAWTVRKSPRFLLIYGGAAVVAAAPYLLKNLILTGNPVYPFFFGGRFWDAARAYWYSRFGTGLDVTSLLFAPIHATLAGVEGGAAAGFPAYGATIGPLYLALIPMLLLLRKPDPAGRRALFIIGTVSVSAYVIWLVQLGASALLVQSRLLLPIFPLLALLAAAGYDALTRWRGWGASAAFVFFGLMALVFGLTAYAYGKSFIQAQPFAVFYGEETRTSYRLRSLGGYMLAMEEVNGLPDGSVVEFLWEPRSYDCREGIICEPDALLDRWWYARQAGMSPEAVRTSWEERGITHVLVFNDGLDAARMSGFDPFDESDWQALEMMLSDGLDVIWNEIDGYSLYTLGGAE